MVLTSKMMPRGLKDFLVVELDRYPIGYRFGQGGKHPFVEVETRDGATAKISLACTSRFDQRTALIARTHLRQTLARLGVTEPDDDARDFQPVAIRDATAAAVKAVASIPMPRPENQKEEKPMLARVEEKKEGGRTPFVKMLQSEIVKATILISTNATIDHIAKSCDYADGWSDERVHAEVAAADRRGLKLSTIVDFRRAQFGSTTAERERERENTRSRQTAGIELSNRKMIEALQTAVASLQQRLDAVEDAATRPTADR